ncbi:MAG: peptidylprolyl isomerase [Planctomycetes bacterium]|nr:peptidylprolyl isomerase [Planctomycetota bacterium]
MAKPQRTGSKQKKARNPSNKPQREEKPKSVNDEIEAELLAEAQHTAATMESARLTRTEDEAAEPAPERTVGKAQAVTINERQIASDTLSLSGDRASDFIARVSDFLQANGKIIMPVVILALIAALGYMFFEQRAADARGDFSARLAEASDVGTSLRGRKLVEKVRENFQAIDPGEDTWAQADYWYTYAREFHDAIDSARQSDRDKMTPEQIKEDNEELFGLFKNYRDVVEKDKSVDPEAELRLSILTGLETAVKADQDFRESKDSRFTQHSDYWKTEAGKALIETKMIPASEFSVENGNPIIAFETQRGTIKVRLFEIYADVDTKEEAAAQRNALRNTIATIIQLVERGYYDHQTIDGVNVPGTASFDNPTLFNSHFVEFGKQGMMKRLPKENETAEEAADAPEKEKRAIDFTILPETNINVKSEFRREVCLYWDATREMFRGSRLAINLGGATSDLLVRDFQVIGELVDEDSLKVAQSLRRQDAIWKAWVVQKRQDTMDETGYLPRVIKLEKPGTNSGKNNIPVLWTEKEPEFIAPRVDKTETTLIKNSGTSDAPKYEAIGDYNTNNSVVVISTDKGDIVMELYEDQTPNTAKNLVYLIEKQLEFLKETSFEVKKGEALLVAGVASGDDSIGYTIAAEAGRDAYTLRNVRGTVAMQHEGSPDSASSAFAFNLDDNVDRDGNKEATDRKSRLGYTVFARVIRNFAALSEFDGSTKITDAWVVQKREGVSYDPDVTLTGDIDTKKASEAKKAN